MEIPKVVVAGGRDFNNYNLLESKLDKILSTLDNPTIVSGKARGADSLGESYAANKGLKVEAFPANWDLHGKAAGYIRNKQMAQWSTHAVIFWDGKSKGSKHMINLAKSEGLKVRVVMYG